mgnify:CR=1 FL=1
MKARNQIYYFKKKNNHVCYETNEVGWDYTITVGEKFFSEIKQFYVPKCYNEKKNILKLLIYNHLYFLILHFMCWM